MDKKKYKIQNDEGVNIFISIGNKPQLQKNIPKKESKKTKKFSYKVFLAFLIIFSTVLSVIYFKNYVNYTRESSKEINMIKKQYSRLFEEINLGNSSNFSYNQKIGLADSLVFLLNNFNYKYPEETVEYNKIWPMVIVYKYLLDWYDHSYFNMSNQKKPILIDSVQEKKINNLYPELSKIVQLLYDLHDYYFYKHRFVSEPEYSKDLVPESEVQELLSKGLEIQKIFLEQSSLLDLNFAQISKFTQIVLNNYYPEIKRWDYFWQNYNKALLSEDAQEVSSILSKLKHDFPNLKVFDKGLKGDISSLKNLTFGVFINDPFFKLSDGLETELAKLLDYIRDNTGRTLVLKKYNSFGLMKRDFYYGNLDFSLISYDILFNFAEGKSAKPIVLKSYKDQPLVSYILYSLQSNKSLDKLDILNMSNKTLIIDGTIFSDIFFEIVSFFDKKAINFTKFFKNIKFFQIDQVDLIHKMFSDFDFIITTEERFEKILSTNKNINKSTAKLLIDQTPSTAIFANTNSVDSLIIEQVTQALINAGKNSNNSHFPNLNKWIRVDNEILRNYQAKESHDIPFSQNMLVIEYKFRENNHNKEIFSLFIKSLYENGYNIINELNYKILKSCVTIQGVKKINFSLIDDDEKNMKYKIEVFKEDEIEYEHTGDITLNINVQNFNEVIESICLKTGYQGEVVEVNKDKVKIYSSISKLLSIHSSFDFFYYSQTEYVPENDIKVTKNNLGNGRFVGVDGNFALLQISNVGGEREIKVGDLVDIMP